MAGFGAWVLQDYLQAREDNWRRLFLRHNRGRSGPGPDDECWRLETQSVWLIEQLLGQASLEVEEDQVADFFIGLTDRFVTRVPGFLSAAAEESVQSLEGWLRTVTHVAPSPTDLYFFLGYNVIVPPYVRQGLLSRVTDNDDLLPQLGKPVLITHGRQDTTVLPIAAEQHAAAIRHAQTSFYPDVGHAPFWEDAPRFNHELRGFARAL
jgi:pimeloyl-ACP methyl ester carboxylesterase